MEAKPGHQQEKDLNTIQTAELKFLTSVKGCSILDKINHEQIKK